MQLDKLQLDLRPRPNAQALDLGFALLGVYAKDIYLAWLGLWLPVNVLCGIMAYLHPGHMGVWLLVAWWTKPLLERAPLYILSRQVFGESVTWQQALRAWPRQLGGGWFRLLTWWRPFMPGRGLYQPIWQLEGACGKVAAERRRVISRENTGRSAYWFGVACANFEGILQLGLLAFIGIFVGQENAINPFSLIIGNSGKSDPSLFTAISFACFAISGAIVGPIYIACCFTLYLNRRATLEAWDIEIMLRQIKPPTLRNHRTAAAATKLTLAILAPILLIAGLFSPIPADAETERAQSPTTTKCSPPESIKQRHAKRTPATHPLQVQLRREVAELYASDDLRGYVCKEEWQLKNPSKKEKEKEKDKEEGIGYWPLLALAAELIKVLLIACAIGVVIWLLHRYRAEFAALLRKPRSVAATEIGGLDIRAESLPKDVAGTVRKLWAEGKQRAALALLYRATLSHLVSDGLMLGQGATEGDCLRLAQQANSQHRLNHQKLQVVTNATDLWLNGAYGNRWPDTANVDASCIQWQAAFGSTTSLVQS